VKDQTNWVSVEERLPEDGGYWLVTVATDDGPEVHTLLFAKVQQQWIHEGEATFCHGYYFRPTHWAPLPAPASDSAAGATQQDKAIPAVLPPDTRAYIESLVAERDSLVEDAERLNWLESAWRDGVHAEVCAKGDGTTWHAMAPSASVFVGPTTYTGGTLRAAIDAARK
jgi:hypothetical protein